MKEAANEAASVQLVPKLPLKLALVVNVILDETAAVFVRLGRPLRVPNLWHLF